MIFILVLTGILAGIVSGMGIGGGAILIPVLTIFLDFEQQTAQNINLIYFIPTAIIALITHNKNHNVEKKGLMPTIIFGIIGAVIGSFIAINLDNEILRKGFGFFLLVIGIRELFIKEKREEN